MAILMQGGIVVSGHPAKVTRADVLVKDDLIIEVAPNVHPPTAINVNPVDCSDMLITPGFINGHIHLNQLLNRGFLDDLSTEDLLSGMHLRHGIKSDEDRYWASLLSIYEGLRSGTTYFGAFATSTGLIAKAMVDAGIRGTITVAKKDQWWGEGTPPQQYSTQEILENLRRELTAWTQPRINLSIGAASDRAASQSLLDGLRKLAADSGVRIYLHVAEGESSVRLSVRYRGCSPAEYLAHIDFLRPNVTLVHASNVSEKEIELIAKAGASICHCPISNAKTSAGTMPLRKIRDAGIGVCLGTDSASTGNTNNILVEGYFAALLHKSLSRDGIFPTAEDIFSLLTIQGARAVGSEGLIGEVRPGLKADLVLWDMRQPAFLPNLRNPLASLIYCASELRPTKVYVDGVLVFDERPLNFDLKEVYARILAYSNRVSSHE